MVQKALNLTISDVERFCAACGISAAYSIEILRDPTTGMQGLLSSVRVSVGAATVFDLAQLFVEVLDHSYATAAPITWIGLFTTLEERLKEIRAIPKVPAAGEFVRKWMLYFNSIPASDEVTEEKRLEIRAEATALSEQLKAWLASKSR
jgi:hypothetical protein